MQFYRIVRDVPGVNPDYRGTQHDAHTHAKSLSSDFWNDVRIELVDIPTDKDSLITLLNGEAVQDKVLRTWALTDRGGLREVPNGE
jgi:hypothetical protein